MEFNNVSTSSGTSNTNSPTNNGMVQHHTTTSGSMHSSGPMQQITTATGVPHFVSPPGENENLLQYFDHFTSNETNKSDHLPHPAMAQMAHRYPVGLHYFPHMGNMQNSVAKAESISQQMPVLPYPTQYPPNMLYQKQQSPMYHIPPHLAYSPLGLFQGGFPAYNSQPSYSPPTAPSTNSASPSTSTTASPPSSNSASISAALLSNTNIKTPQIIYRNLFHTMHCKFQTDTGEWEGARVYINDNVGYSGNAKRFKRKPEKGEKALVLECAILTSNDQPATQCLSCRDYFETQKYYKANPDCIGRIVLVKNNSPIRVENGQFKILIKMMCCCVHHTVDFFTFQLNLLNGDEAKTPYVVFSAKIPLSVKQWRKSNQKKEECLIILEPKA